ncbi:glycine betaine ABC transporter substrate-binding protein [Dactylosporangium sp. NPDC000555]|uniref:glycine betaine ABC transporter substrate-binding protein n=1 Tax=Dactylosporangium sp. NPDC000555 TaxID=3154260 RepID=UPI00331A75D0
MRVTLGIVLSLAAPGLAACGKEGSSGTEAPASVSGAGCAPVAGVKFVVLDDDKKLQQADNVIPAINTKVADPALVAALDKVSDALTPEKLIALNKAVDDDRKTSKVAAEDFAKAENLTTGIEKGKGGAVKIGAADFSESATLGALYEIVLDAAGYDASVQTIGKREVYYGQLTKGDIQVVPEYAATLTEFINQSVNGKDAAPLASSDVDKTVAALKDLGGKQGLSFGKASTATDGNAFAVTADFATKYGVKTLSDFAAKCSGQATILGGPAECPQRPFCQQGLQKTYGIQFGKVLSLDAGGPQSKDALKKGSASIVLVFSSDGSLG